MHDLAGKPLLSALLLFAPLLARGGPALPAQAERDPEVVRGEIGRRLDEYLARLEGVGFSGVVGVEKGGERQLLKGYGLADRETGVPVTTGTVFTVGSITKQFTATAIMWLVAHGQLAVEDSIAEHFENVPPDKAGITIHHLLTHSSGLIDGLGDDWDLQATDDWVLRQALASKLLWEVGQGYRYSNLGYSLLGMIVERVSGMPYERFLREHLFEPAGMLETGYSIPEFPAERLAVGYVDGERWGTVLQRPMLADGPCWNLRANGGIHSTAGDMLRWHHALSGDAILPEEARAALFRPYVDEGGGDSFYGYGWAVSTTPWGTRLIAHNGGNGVFFADFLRFVDDDVVVFLATNVAQGFEPMTAPVCDVVFDRPHELPPETLPRDQAMLERYAGTYRMDEESVFRVEARRDRLAVLGVGEGAGEILADDAPPGPRDGLPPGDGPRIEVFPLSPTEFRTFTMRAGLGRSVRFELDGEGRGTVLELDSELGPIQSYRE